MTLQNKVAIVTGGSKGIGRAISLRLASEGIYVAIASRDLETANKTASEIATSGYTAIAIKTDVTNSQDVVAMTKGVQDKFGNIDILVNNAGGSPHETRTSFHESKEGTWDTVLDVNLKGVLNCTRAIINHMIQRQSGKVINIGSIAGLVGTAGLADYSTAKGGVIAFTKALAKEVAQYHINVNCVCPGPIATEYFLTLSEEAKQRYLKTIPFGRFGKPEEVASMVNFLASSEADFITGQVFTICGGRSLGS
ncbi:SDR family NAD(P)-dependent oxidoreductase [Chloroflexota bacterium]